MNCPHCDAFCGNGEGMVIDSRHTEHGIYRRRNCRMCGRRWSTTETIYRPSGCVLRDDEPPAPFDVERLRASLDRACWKADVSTDALERLAGGIASGLGRPYMTVSTEEIGEAVLAELRTLCPIGYVRYASTFRRLTDAAGFMTILSGLIEKAEEKASARPPDLKT